MDITFTIHDTEADNYRRRKAIYLKAAAQFAKDGDFETLYDQWAEYQKQRSLFAESLLKHYDHAVAVQAKQPFNPPKSK